MAMGADPFDQGSWRCRLEWGEGSRADLAALLWEAGSGRELRARDFGDDVRHAARLDLYAVAPMLRDGRFSA